MHRVIVLIACRAWVSDADSVRSTRFFSAETLGSDCALFSQVDAAQQHFVRECLKSLSCSLREEKKKECNVEVDPCRCVCKWSSGVEGESEVRQGRAGWCDGWGRSGLCGCKADDQV